MLMLAASSTSRNALMIVECGGPAVELILVQAVELYFLGSTWYKSARLTSEETRKEGFFWGDKLGTR